MLVLDEPRIRELLRLDALIPVMEQALVDFSSGRVAQPVRTIVNAGPRALFATMPAVYGDILGAKLVTVYPDNAQRGLPTHLASIQLFRAATGEPIAVLDGRLITELRTAAVSAVATRALAKPDARVLAILGSGVQARAHLEALRLVHEFDDVRVWGRTPVNVRRFADETGVTPMATAADAVRGADVVVTVTNSAEPVLEGAWLSDGVLVNAVGAVGATRRELDSHAMRGTVIVDSRDAAMTESGDVLLAGATVAAELGEVLGGGRRIRNDGIIVFKSLGLAVEDLAAARLVYLAATGSAL